MAGSILQADAGMAASLVFGAPMLAWGALAAGLPIVIHLVLRERARRQAFPAMRLLLQSHQAATRAHRLKHLLLLLCRMCVLLLLVAMFMRTSYALRGQRAAAGWLDAAAPPASAVIAIDDSASMGYRFQSRTRVQAAVEWARSLVQDRRRFPPGSQLAIVTGSTGGHGGPPLPPPPGWTEDLRAGERLLDRIQLAEHDRGANYLLEQAYRMLATARHPRRDVYLFNDLTESSWRSSPLAPPKELSMLYLLDVGHAENNNTALGWPTLPDHVVPAGRPAAISVRVRSGDIVVEPLLEISVDGQPRSRQSLSTIAAGSEVEAAISLPPMEKGTHEIRIDLQPEDALAFDNHRFAIVAAGDLPKVIVVLGEPNREAATLLAAMIAPPAQPAAEQRFQVEQLAAKQLAAAQFSDALAVILADVEKLDPVGWQTLNQYVRSGGTLLAVPGANFSPPGYRENEHLLPAVIESVEDCPEPLHLAAHDFSHPYLKPFTDEGTDSINDRQVYRRLVLGTPEPGARVIAPFGDGKPAALESAVGKGHVVLFAFSPVRQWSQFGSQAAPMIVLLHTMLTALSPPAQGLASFSTGQLAAHSLPELESSMVYLKSPGDEPAKPALSEGGRILLPTVPSGNYRVFAGSNAGATLLHYSVNVAEGESNPVRKTAESLLSILPPDRTVLASDPQELLHATHRPRGLVALIVPLGLGLLALLFIESLFANRFYSSRLK